MSDPRFADRLRELRNEKALSQKALAVQLGYSPSTIANYELGQRQPDIDTLKHLAAYFGVTTDYLSGASDVRFSLPPDASPVRRTVKIPVLGTIPAGEFRLAAGDIEGWEDVPEEQVRDGEYFFLRVTGDCMAPRIQEGYRVLVRVQPTADDGDLVVAMKDGEDATLKRIKMSGKVVILYADNPKYHPFAVPVRDLRIIGKVVKVEFCP